MFAIYKLGGRSDIDESSGIDGSSKTGGNSRANADGTEPAAKKAKTKIPKVLDGTFYSVVSNEGGKIVARCIACGENSAKGLVRGSLSSTGNFKSHYKTHPDQAKELDKYLKEDSDTGSNKSNQTTPSVRDFLTPVNENQVLFSLIM